MSERWYSHVHPQLRRIIEWLRDPDIRKIVGDTIPIPLHEGTKQPEVRHRAPYHWTWDDLERYVSRSSRSVNGVLRLPHATWGLLLDRLCAVDCDDFETATFLEGKVPELATCPMQKTAKGAHFLFARPAWADEDGYWDGARQLGQGGLPVDFKTVCGSENDDGTGTLVPTRGMLQISPSVGKEWIRPLWQFGVDLPEFSATQKLPELPRDLVKLVAKARGSRAKVTKEDKEQRAERLRRSREKWQARTRDVKVVSSGSGSAASPLGFAESSTDYESDRSSSIEEYDTALELLGMLSPWRWDQYKPWRDVATVLRNEFGDAMYDVFKEFSQTSPNYDEEDLDTLWGSVGRDDYVGNRLHIASLRQWATEDVGVGADGKSTNMFRTNVDAIDSWEAEPLGAQGAATIAIVDKKSESLLKLLKSIPRLESVDDCDFSVSPKGVVFNTPDEPQSGFIRRKTGVVALPGGEGVGSTTPVYNMCEPLTFLHDSLATAAVFECNFKSPFETTLTSVAHKTRIDLVRDHTGNYHTAIINVETKKQTSVTNKKKLAMVTALLARASDVMLRQLWGDGVYNLLSMANFVEPVDENDAVEEVRRTSDFKLLRPLRASGVIRNIVAISDSEACFFDETKGGLWQRGSMNDAACLVREAADDGVLSQIVTKVDAAYLTSFDGPIKVLKSIMSKIKDPRFVTKLDDLPDHHIAFDNGLYDASTNRFRPFVKDDYVTWTIGYDFEPAEEVDPELHAAMKKFYDELFPEEEEREYFMRVMAKALFSRQRAKMFIVLSDCRAGDNGKTTLMRAVEAAFGTYHALAERDFIYESFANPNSPAANFLAYEGKRMAFFDEPSKDSAMKRLDIRRIKDLTSGDAYIRGRQLNDKTMQEWEWLSLFVIACNEANFPHVDADDVPFLKRMKVISMRSKFVAADVYKEHMETPEDEREEHVFPQGVGAHGAPGGFAAEDSFGKWLKGAPRMAHVHILAEAYKRHLAANNVFVEPACVVEQLNQILEESDPRVEKALEFVDANVDFKPVRGPEHKGKTYFAWIVAKELYSRSWDWYVDKNHEANKAFRDGLDKQFKLRDRKSDWKTVVAVAMRARRRVERQIRPVGGDDRGGKMWCFVPAKWVV